MSSMDSPTLEFFADDSWMWRDEQEREEFLPALVQLLEPWRETLEYSMDNYDPEEYSWRAYRNSIWPDDCNTDELEAVMNDRWLDRGGTLSSRGYKRLYAKETGW